MKRGTDLKLKYRELKAMLNIPDWKAKGLLQSIWDFTTENAIAGDIGRFTNRQIAVGIEYDGDPDQLINSLVTCRWLDHDDQHRLVVHDWHEHCEDWVKKRAERGSIAFASDNGGQRLPPSDNGGLPEPEPEPEPEPSPKTLSSKKDERARAKPTRKTFDQKQVEALYDAYAKHVGRAAAFKAIEKSLAKMDFDTLLASTQRFTASVQSKKGTDDWRYVPHPATWFNREGYLDEPDDTDRPRTFNPIFDKPEGAKSV